MNEFSYQVKHDLYNTPVLDELKNRIEEREDPYYDSDIIYKHLLRPVLRVLKGKNKRVVAIFENVIDPDIFRLAQKVFDPDDPHPDVCLILFTTTNEALHKDFRSVYPTLRDFQQIGLEKLSGEDVFKLIEQRWKQLSAKGEPPFDKTGIVDAFNMVKEPFRRVIGTLRHMMDRKVKSLKPGKDWPQDRSLCLSCEEIYKYVLEFQTQAS